MRCSHCTQSREPGWLCAEHPGRPWGHDDCRAEATRCVCNPTGAMFGTVIADDEPFTDAELAEAARPLTAEELADVEAERALRDRPRNPMH